MFDWEMKQKYEQRDDEFELVLICRDVSGSSLLELELIVYIEDNFYTCTFVQQKMNLGIPMIIFLII